MSLIPTDRIVNTLLVWFKAEEATFNTIIDEFYQGKQITFFDGIRKVIPESSLPSIEVGMINDEMKWDYCRVQGDTFHLECHLTISNKLPREAQILESRLASLMIRILFHPIHVRGRIEGTNYWMFDSQPSSADYGSPGYNFNIRVCKIPWTGRIIWPIPDVMFPEELREGKDHFPDDHVHVN
jgi:hypothetical protein